MLSRALGTGSDLKPCAECLQRFGKPGCTHVGCCLFEDVPGQSAEQALLGHDAEKVDSPTA